MALLLGQPSATNMLITRLSASNAFVGDVSPGFIGGGVRKLDEELFSAFDELRTEREKTDRAIDAFAESVTAEALASNLQMVRRGQTYDLPMWWAVTQMFNHQTHHRGQITTLLFQAGQDPGSTDLFAMLMEEGAPR